MAVKLLAGGIPAVLLNLYELYGNVEVCHGLLARVQRLLMGDTRRDWACNPAPLDFVEPGVQPKFFSQSHQGSHHVWIPCHG